MDIIKELKTNRPKLSNGSLKTYKSVLTSLYKEVYGDDDITLDKFNDDKTILKFLKDKNA